MKPLKPTPIRIMEAVIFVFIIGGTFAIVATPAIGSVQVTITDGPLVEGMNPCTDPNCGGGGSNPGTGSGTGTGSGS